MSSGSLFFVGTTYYGRLNVARTAHKAVLCATFNRSGATRYNTSKNRLITYP